jgi:general stress protein 26
MLHFASEIPMDPRAKVYEIVKKFSTTMMVTLGPENRPEARPMHIAKAEENGSIWFFTGSGGRVANEVAEDPYVLLVFQDERSSYLTLRGNARVVNDRATMKELWSEPYKVWFPGGLDDPELTLIAVEPLGAEYWDNGGLNRIEYLYEAAKAYVTGTTPKVNDPEEHAKVTL